MSGSLHAWYSLRDLESLADRGIALHAELTVDKLPRLLSLLESSEGSVRATLTFSQRRDGWLGAALKYDAAVQLVCQRCLEPFRHQWADRVDIALADATAVPSIVPDAHEPFELEGGKLQPVQLIEDELIVSLPLVPKHARIADCGSLARSLAGLAVNDVAAS
jgi:uncharacterized protein